MDRCVQGQFGFVPVGRSSRQNVRLCRSVLVVSSASFSEEFTLLTESLHYSNSSVEIRSSVSLVTNTTSRPESMLPKSRLSSPILHSKLLRITQLTGNLSPSITAKFP